ncbi:MAG: sulfite exporter TauE/SafE family protein [Halobacteriota archaeon]
MVVFSLADIALVVAISFVVCTLATSLAVESAALFVPAFLLLFPSIIPGFPTVTMNEAIGLTLIIMFFGQTSTLVGYWYREQVRTRVAAAILVVTIPLAAMGRIAAYSLPESWLLTVFAIILFALTIVVFRAHTTQSTVRHDGGSDTVRHVSTRDSTTSFDLFDRLSFGIGGLVAGLVGFAVGEVTNTRLHVSKGLPIKISTGTSTLVLFLTILTANVVNLVVLATGSFGVQGTVAIPWSVAAIIAPVVLIGGQAGAYLNSRLSESITVKLLLVTYVVVGIVTLSRVIL